MRAVAGLLRDFVLTCCLRCVRYEEPYIEDLFRLEQELNRVGKTRSEGRVKPLRNEVIEMIKLSDYNLDIVNWDKIAEDEENGSVSAPRTGAPEISSATTDAASAEAEAPAPIKE